MRGYWLALAVAVGVGVETGVRAQNDPLGKGEKIVKVQRINLDCSKNMLEDVVARIRRDTGRNIEFANPNDTKLKEEKVTLKLSDVPWREALDIVTDQVGAIAVDETQDVVLISRPPHVTMTFANADLKSVINSIAQISGTNIIVSPGVSGNVNTILKDIPWKDALISIVKTTGDYTVVEEGKGKGRIYRVVKTSELSLQMTTRVFQLKYLRPPTGYSAYMKKNDFIQAPQADSKQFKPEEDFVLLKAMKDVRSKQGSMSYDPESNTLLVTDTKPKLDDIEAIINRLDVEPRQILVDVKFISTANTDSLNFGFDIGSGGLGVSINGGSMLHRLPFNLGRGGFEDKIGVSQANTSMAANPDGWAKYGPNTGDVGTTSPYTFGQLNFSQAQITFNMLKNDVESQILQAPRVLALDHKAATILIADEVRWAEISTNAQEGVVVTQIKEASGSPVTVGFQLMVIPHIIPQTEKVFMTVIPRQSDLTGPNNGFDTLQIGTQSIDLPRVRNASLVTHMIVDSGNTAVIGGLMKNNESLTVRKWPLLGDIPVLGWLFKYQEKSFVKTNLIIFITPQVVRSSQETQALINADLKKRIAGMKGEFAGIMEPTDDLPGPAPAAAEAAEPAKAEAVTEPVSPSEVPPVQP